MAQTPRRAAFAVASMLLFGLGGLATYWSLAWSVEVAYEVDISTPNGVAWVLWVPHPGISMPSTTAGTVTVVGAVDTAYGTLLNLTGTGSGRVRFATRATGFGPDPFRIGPRINLTGQEGQGQTTSYRVFRWSSNVGANLTLAGGLPLSATRLDESWACGGGGFFGYPAEGWNALPRGFGDCVVFASVFPGLVLAALFIPAAVLAVMAARHRDGPA